MVWLWLGVGLLGGTGLASLVLAISLFTQRRGRKRSNETSSRGRLPGAASDKRGACACCYRNPKEDVVEPLDLELGLMRVATHPPTPQVPRCTSLYIGEDGLPIDKPEFPPARFEIPDVSTPGTPTSIGRSPSHCSSSSSLSSSTSVDTVLHQPPPSWKPPPPPRRKKRPPTPPVRAPTTRLSSHRPPTPIPAPRKNLSTPPTKKTPPPTKPKPVGWTPPVTPRPFPKTPTPQKPPRNPRLPRTVGLENLSKVGLSCPCPRPRTPTEPTTLPIVSVSELAPPPRWSDIEELLEKAVQSVMKDAESMQMT